MPLVSMLLMSSRKPSSATCASVNRNMTFLFSAPNMPAAPSTCAHGCVVACTCSKGCLGVCLKFVRSLQRGIEELESGIVKNLGARVWTSAFQLSRLCQYGTLVDGEQNSRTNPRLQGKGPALCRTLRPDLPYSFFRSSLNEASSYPRVRDVDAVVQGHEEERKVQEMNT
eukprot:1158274-Pelagomonas_calceolata.AAC.41